MDSPRALITVSAHLPADDAHLLDDLRARARAADRSVSAEVRRALRDYLNDNGVPPQDAEVKTEPLEPARHEQV